MTICGEPLHHGPITGLSVCAWKTIFMTSGQIDKTVCVWDYTTENLLLSKHYHEQVYCVDLHPTGKNHLFTFMFILIEEFYFVLIYKRILFLIKFKEEKSHQLYFFY